MHVKISGLEIQATFIYFVIFVCVGFYENACEKFGVCKEYWCELKWFEIYLFRVFWILQPKVDSLCILLSYIGLGYMC